MSRRTDYFDDPAAPHPNSIVPAASAIVRDQDGAILLQQRRDNDLWALPGGAMEPGESIQDTAVREVGEETGFQVRLTGLIGIYSDPRHVIAYDDGEVRQEFNVCFAAIITGGKAAVSGESHQLAFVSPGELTRYPMHPTTRRRIDDYLEKHSPTPN